MRVLKVLIFSLLLFLSANVFAADKDFTLRLSSNSMAHGESISLYLDFEGTSDIARPDIEIPQGLLLRYRGPSSQISIVNGQTKRSITHSYALIAQKAGAYQLGPIVLSYGSDRFVSNSVQLKVFSRKEAAQDNQNRLGDYVFVRLSTSKNKIYVNEYFGLTVDLLFRDLSLHNLQVPKLESDNFIVEEFEQPIQDTVLENGVRYHRVRFNAKAYAKKPGELKLDPVLVQVDMAVQNRRRRSFGGFDSMFDDFFGSASLETLYLSSQEKDLTVLEVPRENKPVSFSGLIGDFSLDLSLDSKKLKAGDPLTMKITLKGTGPLNLVKDIRPNFPDTVFKVYEPQIDLGSNYKSFEYVIIPKKPGIFIVDDIGLWVFETSSHSYKFLSQGPVEIEVTEASLQESAQLISSPLSEVSTQKEIDFLEGLIFIKEEGQRWIKVKDLESRYPSFFFYLPIIVFALLFFPFYHKNKMKSDKAYALRKKAPKVAREGLKKIETALQKNDSSHFYEEIFKTVQIYISFKLNCSVALVDQNIVAKLKESGYSEQDCKDIVQLLDACDIARYAASTIDIEKMNKDYQTLKSFLFK